MEPEGEQVTTPRVIRDEDRLSVVTRSRWLAWFGLILCGTLGLHRIVLAVRIDEPGTSLVHWGIGGVLLATGLVVFTLAHVAAVDRGRRVYRSGWMTLGWWLAREGPLDPLAGVVVRSLRDRGVVGLVGMTADRVLSVVVTPPVDGGVAREIGAEVAAFTGLRLFDETAPLPEPSNDGESESR